MIQSIYATLDAPPISGAMQACSYLLRKHAPLYMRVGGFQNRVSQPGKQGKPLTPQTKAKALEMLGCGLSTGQTANSLGISIQSVRNIKKEAERGPNYSRPIPAPTPTNQIALNRVLGAQEGVLA